MMSSVMKQVTMKFGRRLLGLWGKSHPGGPIGAAPQAPTAAVVHPAQGEPFGEWSVASLLGARLPDSRGMVAHDFRGVFP